MDAGVSVMSIVVSGCIGSQRWPLYGAGVDPFMRKNFPGVLSRAGSSDVRHMGR